MENTTGFECKFQHPYDMPGSDIYVPEHTQSSLQYYLEYRIEPGSFLTAVLRHDLFEAFARADETNRAHLFGIVSWIHNHAPSISHGSKEKVSAWLEKKDNNEPTTG